MVKTLNTPNNSLHKRQCKDKYFEAQKKRVFAGFYTANPGLLPSIVEPSNTVKL